MRRLSSSRFTSPTRASPRRGAAIQDEDPDAPLDIRTPARRRENAQRAPLFGSRVQSGAAGGSPRRRRDRTRPSGTQQNKPQKPNDTAQTDSAACPLARPPNAPERPTRSHTRSSPRARAYRRRTSSARCGWGGEHGVNHHARRRPLAAALGRDRAASTAHFPDRAQRSSRPRTRRPPFLHLISGPGLVLPSAGKEGVCAAAMDALEPPGAGEGPACGCALGAGGADSGPRCAAAGCVRGARAVKCLWGRTAAPRERARH